jgi:hypothetical protein
MSKCAALLLIAILTVSSLGLVNLALAFITTPSVPEFTLKFVDHSYDVPPTYGIDQYTGKTVITQSGHHQENTSIEVTIKNQPFTPYTDASGHFISLYYNFTFKGHYGDKWSTYRDPHYWAYVNASHSDYTVTSFPLESYEFSDVSAGGQVDFRVEALIGYQTTTIVPTPRGPGYTYEFTGETSGWSNTQTIAVGTSSSSSSPSPSPSPSQNSTTSPDQSNTQTTTQTGLNGVEIAILTALIIIIVLLIAIVWLALKKRR